MKILYFTDDFSRENQAYAEKYNLSMRDLRAFRRFAHERVEICDAVCGEVPDVYAAKYPIYDPTANAITGWPLETKTDAASSNFDLNPVVDVKQGATASGRFGLDSDGKTQLFLTLPTPNASGGEAAQMPTLETDSKTVDSTSPTVEIETTNTGYKLIFGWPKATTATPSENADDTSVLSNKIQELEENLKSISLVQGLDNSGTSTFFWHNSSDMSKLTEKNGIFYITSATHLRSFGFPGYGRSALLKVIVLGTGFYMWELTIPENGIFATRLFRNNAWQPWTIYNAVNGAFNPHYYRDAVVTLGSSTLASMATQLKSAFEPYGVNFVNKAASGSCVGYVSAAVGANKVRVKFPDGVIPAKGTRTTAELVFDGEAVSLSNQFLLLQNGVKLLVSGTGTTVQVTPRENTVSYDVDPAYEFPAQLYVLNGWENGISIISTGKNDISAKAKAEDLKAPFQSIIDNLKPALQPRFIVVGQFSNPSYSAGEKAELDKYNEWQKKTYGMRYFDLLGFMQSEECKTAMQSATGAALSSEDESLLADGRLPVAWSTEGTTASASHFSEALMNVVSAKIAAKAVELGYIGTVGTWLTSNTPIN